MSSGYVAEATTTAKTVKRSTKGKRRGERNILTFYEKIAVIRYYDESNVSRNSLAKMFQCCVTQIRRILERKDELMQQLATLSEADASIIIEEMTRKRRKFEMAAVSFILYQWVERCRQLRLRKSITNQTLKDTAIRMAAILNLPSFRASYRWLQRFRCKYKYEADDLSYYAAADAEIQNSTNPTMPEQSGELSVEDIIIEFKDALPSFMQKEISFITSTAALQEADMMENQQQQQQQQQQNTKFTTPATTTTTTSYIINDDSSKDFFDLSGEDVEEVSNEDAADDGESDNDCQRTNEFAATAAANGTTNSNAGMTALLNSVFPHFAVIHQFALLNSDVKALELISRLGVHMQAQAAAGAYKAIENAVQNGAQTDCADFSAYAADLDDIVLIE